MRLLITDTKIIGQLITALCNTLIYSLWQGLLLAAAAGLIVVFTKKLSAALRYKLLVSALALFAAGVIATFFIQFENGAHAEMAAQLTVPHAGNATALQTYQMGSGAPTERFTSSITSYLNSHSNTIVLVWFLIICAKSIQLGVGLHGTYRLKYSSVCVVGGHWQERLRQLAGQLGIKRGIKLMESGLAKVPLVIGHIKPVILIPLGLLTALPPREIEAILVHELAHIRRHDFLVNLLQSLMEIVFFFNPAVLWVSQLLKAERENCCDDLALRENNNKANYIRALLSCEEYRMGTPSGAMAFPGVKHSLLRRVKRVAEERNYSLNLFQKALLAVCLVVCGVCLSAFHKKHAVNQHVAKEFYGRQNKKNVYRRNQDTVAPKNNVVEPKVADVQPINNPAAKTDGNPQIKEVAKSKWAELQHDSTNANDPAPKHGYYEDRKGYYDSTYPASGKYAHQAYMDSVQAYYTLARSHAPSYKAYVYDNTTSIYPGAHSPHGTDLQRKNEALLAEITDEMFREGIITQKNNLDFKLTEKEFIVNGQQQGDAIFQRYRDKYVPHENANGWTWTQSRHVPSLLVEITDEMFREGIITQKNDFDFKLTDQEFIVNGQQQGDAIFQRYRDKYVPHENANGWTWTQSRHVQSSSK